MPVDIKIRFAVYKEIISMIHSYHRSLPYRYDLNIYIIFAEKRNDVLHLFVYSFIAAMGLYGG
jgi:hypothetical protein